MKKLKPLRASEYSLRISRDDKRYLSRLDSAHEETSERTETFFARAGGRKGYQEFLIRKGLIKCT